MKRNAIGNIIDAVGYSPIFFGSMPGRLSVSTLRSICGDNYMQMRHTHWPI